MVLPSICLYDNSDSFWGSQCCWKRKTFAVRYIDRIYAYISLMHLGHCPKVFRSLVEGLEDMKDNRVMSSIAQLKEQPWLL
ncbi:hypothetical protein L1887_06058 [Cichorium endivia]|nr:hypothetical protein L1887_06058 [Cichorium endivia]